MKLRWVFTTSFDNKPQALAFCAELRLDGYSQVKCVHKGHNWLVYRKIMTEKLVWA